MAGRLHNSNVARALEESGGMVSLAAARLGCTRQALYQRMARHPRLRELADDAHEHRIESCRQVVLQAALDGDTASARWWVERYEENPARERRIEAAAQASVAIQIVVPDADADAGGDD